MYRQGRLQRPALCARIGWLCLIWASQPIAAHSDPSVPDPLPQRTANLVNTLQADALIADPTSGTSTLPAVQLRIQDCAGYPYEEPRAPRMAHADLLDDLRDDELWSQSYSPHKQMRIWHFKG